MKPTRCKITLEMKSRHQIPLSIRGSYNPYLKIYGKHVDQLLSKMRVDNKNIPPLIKSACIPSIEDDVHIGEKIYISSYRVGTSSLKRVTWDVEPI